MSSKKIIDLAGQFTAETDRDKQKAILDQLFKSLSEEDGQRKAEKAEAAD